MDFSNGDKLNLHNLAFDGFGTDAGQLSYTYNGTYTIVTANTIFSGYIFQVALAGDVTTLMIDANLVYTANSMGGAGADTFRLGGDTKTDHITDFLSGTDRIELDNSVFKALLAEGQLSASQFGQGTAATTAAQRIVYDQPTGNLWYDADGSGKGKAVLIGVLDNHVPVLPTDFWVI
jgi:Ca2+-binding RTX toxin-like protein